MADLPEVLIIGRPNVGKSTLFNRLVGKSIALVDDRPGSTRDIRQAPVTWDSHSFSLVDSGGWVPGESDTLAGQISAHIEAKSLKASLLLWLVDANDGVTAPDEALSRHLRKKGLPIILAVNKADRYELFDQSASDFHRLGVETTLPISAVHGIGIDDLLDALVQHLPKTPPTPEEEGPRPVRIALLGKPNVGKSSLVNALIGQNRLLVDDTPGTTHDAVAVGFEYDGNPLVLVDTAGLRAHKKQDSRIEHLSIQQSLNALQTCQVALFLVDGEKGITHQDVTIGKMIEEAFRPVILLINKWDIHPKGMEQSWAEKITKRQLRSLHFAPVLFISAKSGLNLDQIFPEVLSLWRESQTTLPTRALNDVLHGAVSRNSPTAKKGHSLKVLYGYQRKGHPPAFEIISNHPESTRTSYLRYLEEEIRNAFGIRKTPLQLVIKQKKNPPRGQRKSASKGRK